MAKMPTPDQLLSAIPASFPKEGWMDTKPDFHPGSYCYPAKVDSLKSLGFENAHSWSPANEDWELPENWEEIIYNSLKDALEKHRSLKIFPRRLVDGKFLLFASESDYYESVCNEEEE